MGSSRQQDAQSAAAAETQAFLELVRRKPPATIDGLLNLVSDLRKDRFTERELKRMGESPSGQRLAAAIRQCEGLRHKIKQEASSHLVANTDQTPESSSRS